MAFQVFRADTGQFVITDPATDTVVIDDDLGPAFTRLEHAIAEGGRQVTARPPTTEGTAKPSTFAFQGGFRHAALVLGVVLPFAWLAVLYFALAHLLSEHALDRKSDKQTREQVQKLEREVQALRSELAGAPRASKTKAKPRGGARGRVSPAAKEREAEQETEEETEAETEQDGEDEVDAEPKPAGPR